MYEFNKSQIKKLLELQEHDIEPYPSGRRQISSIDIKALKEVSQNKLSKRNEQVCIAGRLRFKNEMGSLGFGRIDIDGQIIQILIKKNECLEPKDFLTWKKLDIGDWVYICGIWTRTRTGELTLKIKSLNLYAKCMAGMPDKVVGLSDPELRQRMRYLDLIVNKDSADVFKARFGIIKHIRNYMDENNYIEVETPILQVIPGGANARPFVTHHNSLGSELYMRIAPELYLKQLIVGGFSKIYEIGKNFRNEGISPKHNPEFTMIEMYEAHSDFIGMMNYVKNLIMYVIERHDSRFIRGYGDNEINWNDWRTIKFEDSIKNLGIESPRCIGNIISFLSKNNYSVTGSEELSKLQQIVFDNFVEPNLINPTFITHYPVSLSPLARKNDFDNFVTDRFELFVSGTEIANGFTELNDPVDQSERFEQQVKNKNSGDDESMYFDKDYIKALTYGMPPTAGAGIGIDRLVMLLTNSYNIRDVILFPTRKRN